MAKLVKSAIETAASSLAAASAEAKSAKTAVACPPPPSPSLPPCLLPCWLRAQRRRSAARRQSSGSGDARAWAPQLARWLYRDQRPARRFAAAAPAEMAAVATSVAAVSTALSVSAALALPSKKSAEAEQCRHARGAKRVGGLGDNRVLPHSPKERSAARRVLSGVQQGMQRLAQNTVGARVHSEAKQQHRSGRRDGCRRQGWPTSCCARAFSNIFEEHIAIQ
eukprot:1777704-Pleurochrysis_carterae.AAC.5